MSRLDELIAELCPDGVEYKKIGELVNYEQPSKYIVKSTDYNDAFETPVLTAGQTFILGYTNEENGHYLASKENPVIIFDDFTGAFKWVDFEFKVKSSAIKILTANKTLTSIRYIFHVMGKLNFTSSEHKRLWIGTYSEFEVPVPPLEVQREIVRILDNFTELTAELQAELQARKKQYEHYASALFSDIEADWLPMSEIASFVYGYTDKAKDVGDTRFIRITDITDQGTLNPENAKFIDMTEDAQKSKLEKGDIVMARTGATYGKTLYFDSDEPSVYASFLIKITPDKTLNSRYYWHFTKTPLYWEQANKLVSTGGQPQFNTPALKQVKIPLPSLKKQEYIVSVLDRLDALCNDLSSGLPAEIEARQKQYEYYRDKLLTFKQLA